MDVQCNRTVDCDSALDKCQLLVFRNREESKIEVPRDRFRNRFRNREHDRTTVDRMRVERVLQGHEPIAIEIGDQM